MKTSETIGALAEALAKAQGKIQNPDKGTDNPFFKSKYADLAEVLNVVRPAFSEVGLSIIQSPFTSEDGNIGLATRIMHSSGEWIEGEVNIPLQGGKNVAQDAGSAITYLRRYAAASFSGVAQEDNDGNQGKGKESNTAPVTNLKKPTKAQLTKIHKLCVDTGSDEQTVLNWMNSDGNAALAIKTLEAKPKLESADAS